MNILNFLINNYSYAMDYENFCNPIGTPDIEPNTISKITGLIINITRIGLFFIGIVSLIFLIKNIIHNIKIKKKNSNNNKVNEINNIKKRYENNIYENKEDNLINTIKLENEIENKRNNKESKKADISIPLFLSIISFLFFGILGVVTHVSKPIIYIYPKEKTKVKIKLKYKEKLTCTYPKYEDGWEVEANPNGDLVDLKTNRKLYALYWEGIGKPKYNLKEGFIVEGTNVEKFLEEKLELLGLNEREAEEFIVYWLPKLECNKYNYIRFSLIEEVNEYMPLEITPKPDTLIRIIMQYKPLAFKINVNEQILPKQERKGYTIVEWGGTKI